jgi:transposase
MTKGDFPVDRAGALHYGNGLKVYIINLVVCQMVAIDRVQKLIKSMIGTLILKPLSQRVNVAR